jgi:hypothetical protein
MNPQKPIRSRFVPLAPPAPPTRHDRFLPLLPGVTKGIPPADEISETTIDPRLKTVMKRLMPFEAVLAQCVTASPNSGRILAPLAQAYVLDGDTRSAQPLMDA